MSKAKTKTKGRNKKGMEHFVRKKKIILFIFFQLSQRKTQREKSKIIFILIYNAMHNGNTRLLVAQDTCKATNAKK